jgi:hypothetical protein
MMLFGLPEMKVFAETSSDPRIKALWSRLEEARKKNALWCEEVNTLRDQLRWRKWPEEKPEVGQHYLLMAGAKAPTVAEFTGENFRFPSRIVDGVTHWRPIGELPGE